MSDIFLGNSEETFDFSFEATSGELINQMSDGKIGKIEHIAWGSTQLNASRFDSCTAIPDNAQKTSLYVGWKG